MLLQLKENMKLGVASAATQIEGGELNHSWNDWYEKGKITDGSNPANANQHYEKWKEDADLLKQMGITIYRMGLEWARIEPEENRYDLAVIEHYRKELEYLKELGIEPLLTIHHFTNPMWFEEKGGFSKPENAKNFLKLVKLVVRSFGDIVSEYITINEPNVYAVNSWFYGMWPPGEKSFKKTMDVMSVLAACHIKAYRMIHRERVKMGYSDTKVGFANHLRVFEPENPKNLKHKACCKTIEWMFQKALTKAMCTGEFEMPLRNMIGAKVSTFCDFIAINYYSRSTISGFGDGVRKNAPVNDLGWEIYPEGIIKCAQEMYDIIKRPIYITENGTCDNEDKFRSRFIYDHLKALSESDLPIERYYHWCFCDNFEWLEGESARFGLVHIDYETQERTVKKSGEFYQRMIEEHGVTEEMFEKYVANEKYNIS